MSIHFQCPACQQKYRLSDELAGKTCRCQSCGEKFRVPQPGSITSSKPPDSQPASTKPAPAKPSPAPTASASSSSLKAPQESPSKPTPPKLATPKATLSQPTPAKPKPPNKPQPAPKKNREDDFFEDDFDTGTQEFFDEVDQESGFDEVDEYRDGIPKPSKRRNKKKKSGVKISGLTKSLGAIVGGMRLGLSPFSWLIMICLGVCVTAVAFPMAMLPILPFLMWGGVGLLILSGLWNTVVTFRVSVGWGLFFILAGTANVVLSATGRPGMGAVVSIVSFLISIMLLIEHWDEYRGPVLCSLAAWVLIMTGPLAVICGLAGAGRFPQQGPPFPLANRPRPGNIPVNVPNLFDAKPKATGVEMFGATDPFPVASVPVPPLPEFSLGINGQGETFLDPTVTCMRHFFINAKSINNLGISVPGRNTVMIYFEPKGTHAPRSLPCILVASAGSNLLEGRECPSKEYVSETLPYVKSGFAVIGFSLDGYSPQQQNGERDTRMTPIHFTQFQNAFAGLVNVRNVVEFATQKIPQVDPHRLYISGHSSAATLALLAAAHEPRLKGAVAYAPATNVETRLKDLLSQPDVANVLPGVHRFAKQSSPLTHVQRMKCPIFLFHAADDSNVPIAEMQRFAQVLRSTNKSVEFVEVPTGGHYDSMIQQGIPRAIPWLKQLAGTSGSNAAPVVAQDTATQRPNSGVTPVPPVPQFPFPNVPQNANVARQPSGRMVTFRFQSFGGQGDAAAAARQALRDVPWADLNDLAIDPAKGEIRIGQLGGAVNSGPAHQALTAAGFQMLPGVSIGSKASLASTAEPPKNDKNEATKPATATSENIPDVPAKNPPANSAASKSKPAIRPPPNNPPEKRPERATARRIVTFRYERFTGKGASANAMKEALKRIDWADQDDIVMDASKKEIRIGLLAEAPDFEQARKALTNQGFVMSTGVTTSTTKD